MKYVFFYIEIWKKNSLDMIMFVKKKKNIHEQSL